ncbi:MAG: type III secretion system stator protein SctL [Pseudomonadota bacterium]
MSDIYRLADIGLALPAGTRILKASTAETLTEAELILAAAREKAASIIAESEAIYEARREEGYRDGEAEAARDTLAALIAEQATLDAALKAIEGRLSGLIVACVASILGDADDALLAERLARAALSKMRQEERAQLFVPVPLVPALRDRATEILATFPEVQLLDVVGDTTLSPPTVVLQSSLGRVRCNLDDALTELDATLRGALSTERPPATGIEVTPAPLEPTP